MQDQDLMFLSPDESKLLSQLSSIFDWDYPEHDLLPFIYINIKLQGSAFKMDVMQLSSIGIPIFVILAADREQPIFKIVEHLRSGSINFYQIKRALETFVDFYKI